ncbi:MAG: cytochrome c oxidase subunit 3 [Halioglobus sp.]|nr:cytochrome c oxidase subunit 3 [Halioglobus sp.]
MKILKILGTKPWLHEQAADGPATTWDGPNTVGASRTALRFVLAMVGVLFFLFIITFLSRSQYPDFEALAGAPWQPFTDTSRLWFNTGLLALASIAMQCGLVGARHDKLNVVVASLSAAVFFTVMFIVAQLDLWLYLQSMGYYINSNPANSYFYLLTAVHGLHLIGGLIVLSNVVFRVWYDNDLHSLAAPLQLCTTYWHFLFGVWLVLFALLSSRPETINALAAMCGF